MSWGTFVALLLVLLMVSGAAWCVGYALAYGVVVCLGI